MPESFDAAGFLKTLTARPGVYRMLDAAGTVLYVGKARNLKQRVSSYFGAKSHLPKTQALMNHVERVEVTVTTSEQEALLLEYNLIKAHSPRFNVLLRDDKSYPYIRVTTHQEFPRFEFHRGSRKAPGRYFGPYPNAGAVRQVLVQLQKLFRVRQCRDSFFANRSRPCLQHQIQRCTAPCVELVTPEAYGSDVNNAIRFLEGRNEAVIDDLIARMEGASRSQAYETAAAYRDQIAAIKALQTNQIVAGARTRDADVLATVSERGVHCVALTMVRGGRVLGTRTLFPRTAGSPEPGELLSAFIVQHYFTQPAPPELLVATAVDDQALVEDALSKRAGHRVAIRHQLRGTRRRWVEMAGENAGQAARQRLLAQAGLDRQFSALGQALGLDGPPERIECFDISHTGGEGTVASCVAWTAQGALKSGYRRYNIRTAAAADDYAAIREAVSRRYAKAKSGEAPLPDLVLIDGGRGQLNAALAALEELQLGGVELVGVAKGSGRKPGREKLLRADIEEPLLLAGDSPALHLVQQIRDEAHRFAITGHRQRRERPRRSSGLEEISGVGPRRRRALLQRFGGLQGIRRAAIDDLASVSGISRDLARRIFEHFHGGAES